MPTPDQPVVSGVNEPPFRVLERFENVTKYNPESGHTSTQTLSSVDNSTLGLVYCLKASGNYAYDLVNNQ